MKARSLLFVPGDRPDRFVKAQESGADAVILDLEDAVSPGKKAYARSAVSEFLGAVSPIPTLVRINPLSSVEVSRDLDWILPRNPAAIVLPKAEGAPSILSLLALMGDVRVPILPIATETPLSVFQLGTYASVAQHLAGLTWGAEDLPAATGALSSRHADGGLTAPYQVVRALALFAAHTCQVPAIETVFPNLADEPGLIRYLADARRDGFSAMMAVHPKQISIINQAFTPTPDEIQLAMEIVNAFEASEDPGVLQLRGRMIDRPHLLQARRVLERSELWAGN